MRKAPIVFIALLAGGCSSDAPTGTVRRSLPPPTLTVIATTRSVTNSQGGQDLEVTARLQNSTSVHIQLVSGLQCPLFVRLFLDPSGEFSGLLDGTMGCPTGLPTMDIPPGASLTLSRTIPQDSLVAFAPGKYGVNIAITTNGYVQGAWAGAIDLPLQPSQ